MFSNPSAVVLMSAGYILHMADEAVLDFDSEAVGKLDDLMQEFATVAKEFMERAKKIPRSKLP